MKYYERLFFSFLALSSRFSLERLPSPFNACLLMSATQFLQIAAILAFVEKAGLVASISVSRGLFILVFGGIIAGNMAYHAVVLSKRMDLSDEIGAKLAIGYFVMTIVAIVVVGALLFNKSLS